MLTGCFFFLLNVMKTIVYQSDARWGCEQPQHTIEQTPMHNYFLILRVVNGTQSWSAQQLVPAWMMIGQHPPVGHPPLVAV